MFEPWAKGTPPQSLSEALFDGRLVLFEDLPSVSLLVRRARALLEGVLATDDPVRAEKHLSEGAFRAAALKARKTVAADPAVARHWRDTLAAVGYRPEDTWLDRIRLRVVPSRTDIDHPRLQVLPPHRDTWGSGIAAQVNWWLPLYPLCDTRTMLVWPHAFRRAIANDSGDWSFDAFRQDRSGDYALLPVAGEPPPTRAVPVSMAPGQLLAFSAAHLHAGTSDASGVTRLGIDTRTVWEPARRAGRGAPNVDCAAGTGMWRWYIAPRGAAAAEAT